VTAPRLLALPAPAAPTTVVGKSTAGGKSKVSKLRPGLD
jgi:hypothetical protein